MPGCWTGRGFAAGLIVVVMATVSGCGGGGGGGTDSGPVVSASYFPAAVGDRWVYRLWQGESEAGSERVLIKATSSERSHGYETVLLQSYGVADGVWRDSQYLSVTDAVVKSVPAPGDAQSPSIDLLRFPMATGDSYAQLDTTLDAGGDFDGDGRNETIAIHSTVQVVGFESMTIDEGPLPQAAHLQTVFEYSGIYSSGAPSVKWSLTIEDWYAEGIGLVREDQLSRYADGSTASSHMVLAGHSVSGRKSEQVAPTATLVSPDSGAKQPANVSFDMLFSEPMDFSSVGSSLALLDPHGDKVPLTLTAPSGDGPWRAAPASALSLNGHYTLSVEGATDLLGTPIEAMSWQIDVDAEAPVVVATSPVADAGGVPLDAAITIDFNEEVDAASVQEAVSLSTAGAYVPITVAVQGRRATVTPIEPLLLRSQYRVAIQPWVKDLLGNLMTQGLTLDFRTDPGQYDYPVVLAAGRSPQAVATGDVNGDGRHDVVMTNFFYFDPDTDYKLFVFLQQADGSLAAPVALPTQASYGCPPSSVAVADLDGDGRKDVAIGESGCGIEIFLQGPDGQLSSSRFIASAQSHKIVARDLDGDGRADLVGAGWGTDQVAVWRQGVDGQFAPAATYGLHHGGWEDLAVGDLNGDGRPDIVVSGSGLATEGIGILYQRAGGDFGGARYLAVADSYSASAVAVGDIDGDGRDDLAAGTWFDSKVWVFYQRTDGTLRPKQEVPSYWGTDALELADLDGDGRQDIIVKNDAGFAINRHRPDGSLGVFELYAAGGSGGVNTQSLAVGDVTGDGRPDLVASGLVYLPSRTEAAVSAMSLQRPLQAPRRVAPKTTSQAAARGSALPSPSALARAFANAHGARARSR